MSGGGREPWQVAVWGRAVRGGAGWAASRARALWETGGPAVLGKAERGERGTGDGGGGLRPAWERRWELFCQAAFPGGNGGREGTLFLLQVRPPPQLPTRYPGPPPVTSAMLNLGSGPGAAASEGSPPSPGVKKRQAARFSHTNSSLPGDAIHSPPSPLR